MRQESEVEHSHPLNVWRWIRSYARFIYRFPFLVAGLVLVFVAAMSAWLLIVYGFNITANIVFYRWSGDEVLQKWDNFVMASEDTYPTYLDKVAKSEQLPQQSMQTKMGIIVYQTFNGTVLDVDKIREIWRLEDKLMSDPGWADNCYKPPELIPDPYTIDQVTGCYNFESIVKYIKVMLHELMGYEEVYPENLTQPIIDMLVTFGGDQITMNFVGRDYKENKKSALLRTMIPLGLPHKGYNNKADQFEEQTEEIADWGIVFMEPILEMQNNAPLGLKAFPIIPFAIDKQISQVVMKQVYWLIGSFGFLFVFSIIHMRSFFASIFGVIGVFMSIPCAISFQFGVLTIHHFDALNVIGLFLICGIGSDCVFIIFDLFRQSKSFPEVTPELRLAYAAQHGILALACSISTAAVSFLALISSGVRIMQFFGVFCFFELLFAFLLTFTWYLAILAIWEKYLEDFKPKCCCKKPEQLNTDLLTEEGRNNTENQTEESLIVEYIPYKFQSMFDCFTKFPVFNLNASGLKVEKYSLYERFFHNYVSPIVYFYRLPIVILFLGITIAMGIFAVQMKSKSELQFLGDDHPLQHAYTILIDGFVTSLQDFSMVYVWGLEPKLKSTFKQHLTPDNYGTPRYTHLDLSKKQNQQDIYDACQVLKNADFIDKTLEDYYICPIEYFANYSKSLGYDFPVDDQVYYRILPNFTKYLSTNFAVTEADSVFPGTRKKDTIGFSFENDLPKYIAIKANMYLTDGVTSDKVRVVYDKVEALAKKIDDRVNPDLKGGYGTSYGWPGMITQEKLPGQSLIDVALSIGFSAFTILCATVSIYYTIFVVYSMTCVVVTILGILFLMGWKIGTNEAVMISILSGFCADFIVQPMLSMAHDHSVRSSFGKLQSSLTMFCSPVSSALCTTLAAAAFLFPSEILLFPPFAAFLCMSGLFGIIYGFIVLPAIIMLFSPVIDWFRRICSCHTKKNHRTTAPTPTPEPTVAQLDTQPLIEE